MESRMAFQALLILLAMFSLLGYAHCQCQKDDWVTCFDQEGLCACRSSSYFIRGLWRSQAANPDYINRLEEVECCNRESAYWNAGNQVTYADWWGSLDRNDQWNVCPAGFFLQGLYRSNGGQGWLHSIEEGRCSKPATHPYHHGHCYDQDILLSFDNAGKSACNDGYFITGLYRGGCDELKCIEKLRCCRMSPRPDNLDSLDAVKTRIMDITLSDISLLAHYLGYGWCSGCRAPYVGEDFRRNGDTWEADKSGRCSGYMSDYRLSLNYGDWKFEVKNIWFGQPVINDLTPETIDSGTLINNDPHPATKTILREEQTVRTVTHTTTSSWKHAHELNVQITYTPPSATGGVGGSVGYKFNYESSTTNEDSTSNQQVKKFSVQEQKTLGAYTAANWNLVLSKTRTTIPYTAKIIVKFSTELRGFLRWGGGWNDPGTNYHYEHRGSGARPTVNYRFGNAGKSFYEALKQESDTNSRPWLWSDMKNAYSYAQPLINKLTNEAEYEFTLTGKFEDITGKHVSFRWDAIKPLAANGRRRRRDSSSSVTDSSNRSSKEVDTKILTTIAEAKAGDPPPVFPPPPNVTLEVPKLLVDAPKVNAAGN